MEGQFVIKRLVESGTCTEYFRRFDEGDWIWVSKVDQGSTFSYEMAKLVAHLVLKSDRLVMPVTDLPIYSIVRVDYYEEYIK